MPQPFDFDTPIDRRATASLKWDRYGERDILPLWIADMDFRSPPAVIAALHERVEHGVYGYTHAPPALLDTIVARLGVRYGWTIEPDWIVWLPGLVSGLNVTCRAIGEDGDDVLTLTPIYPPFLEAPAQQRRRLATVALRQDRQRWTIDFERLEAAVTPRTRLLMLCNPHNPVGRVYTREELTRLAAFADRHNLTICSDEIHCDLVLDTDKSHTPIATLDHAIAARTITLMAPSKTFNLPGLGCGFAVIANEALRRCFKQAMAGIVPYVNAFGYTAALAAYRNGGDWHETLLSYLRGNRKFLAEAISALPGLAMAHVEATYLAWIDARALDLDNPARFFERAGIGLSDGTDFAAPGFVRLNFATSRSQLEAAVERLRTAL
jgi:cystathionine beta-lyase